ncbi:MAG TPA: GNAT family N-acetyltransferase [Candidatus Acidoferrales bacterium]|nr:GNAT family N-acetyltransferase [Candidatus Acidoferrales bacterium]
MPAAPDYFLRSSRLGFRHWSSDDLPLALALWGDPRVTRLIGGPFSDEQVRERIEKEMASMRDHQVQYWPMFLLADGQHVGCAGLRPYKLEERIHELGFHLRPEFWGQGLAEEAARVVIAYAFATLHAKALFAGHHPDNTASRHLLEKLGFRFVGTQLYPATGLQHPSYLLRHL